MLQLARRAKLALDGRESCPSVIYCYRPRQSSMNSANAPHRRQFVRAALATAVSYGRILGANDRVRIGAIGTGGRGQYLLSQLKLAEQNDIVACCDVYEPRRLPAPMAFPDHLQAFEREVLIDLLEIARSLGNQMRLASGGDYLDRKSTRLNSSHLGISY